jgi:hypothetical protein
MIKKVVLFLVLIIVVFHVAWYATSRMHKNEKIPDEAVVQAVFDNILKDGKISIDRNSFKDTYI